MTPCYPSPCVQLPPSSAQPHARLTLRHSYSRLLRLCVSVSLPAPTRSWWQIPCSQQLAASCTSLCALFRTPFLCFQSFAASFSKTPGVGGTSARCLGVGACSGLANPGLCSPFVFILLRIHFPATPFLSHPYKTLGVWHRFFPL